MTRAMVPASTVLVDLGDGQGMVERDAIDWQVSRSLSGGGLPGQARAVSGSSVGSGSVTIPAPAGTPWPGATPGGAVEIDATHDLEALADQGPVGWRAVCRMQARSIAWDSWLSPVRSVQIEDRVPRGSVDIPIDITGAALDASSVIERAANAVGLRSTPPPASSAVIAAPMVGSLWAERGPNYSPSISDGARYATNAAGVAMLTDSLVSQLTPIGDPSTGAPGLVPEGSTPATFAIAFTVAALSIPPTGGTYRPIAGVLPDSNLGGAHIEVSVTGSGSSHLRIMGYSSTVTLPLPASLTADGYPARIVVTWEAASPTDWQGLWRVYVNGALVAPPESRTVPTGRGLGLHGIGVYATAHGAIGAVQLGTSLDPLDYGLLENETALIGASGSPLDAIIEPTSGDAWAIIQDVARATLGAAWIDERGRLVYRGREALRTGVVVATVDALDRVEDIPGSIGIDEVADRVEVTYRPPVLATSMLTDLTVLDSDEVLTVNAGATVSITRDLDVATVGSGGMWLRWEDTGTYPVTQQSRYAAWTAPPGESGSAPPDSALVVSSQMLTPTRIRVTIRNTTGSRLWVYRVVARSTLTVTAGAPITLASGATEREARNPLTLDLGAHVQSADTARGILDWLTGETSSPQPVLSDIRVAADTDLRLGDTILLRIESMTGDPAHRLVLKALITGVNLSASAGSLDQRLTLTTLAPTEADLAAYYARHAIATEADVAALWASLSLPTEADVAAWMARGGIYA